MMDTKTLQRMISDQITRAMQNGYRGFDGYDLERYRLSGELMIDDSINIILVEQDGEYSEPSPDISSLSHLYFSRQCEFLRFLLGEQRYLKVAHDTLGLEDTQRLLEVNKAIQ